MISLFRTLAAAVRAALASALERRPSVGRPGPSSPVGPAARRLAFLVSAVVIVGGAALYGRQAGLIVVNGGPTPGHAVADRDISDAPGRLGYREGDEGIDPWAPASAHDYTLREPTSANRSTALDLAAREIEHWLHAAPGRRRLQLRERPQVARTAEGMRVVAWMGTAVASVVGLIVELRRVGGRWRVVESRELWL